MAKRQKNNTGHRLFQLLCEVGDAAAETLWPTRCAICDRGGELLCRRCMTGIPYTDTTLCCPSCGAPYGHIQCTECNDTVLSLIDRERLPLDAVSHAVCLTEDTKRIVTVFKDKDELRLCGFIAQAMARYIDPDWIKDACLYKEDIRLTYIPSTADARRRRGFDHAQMIAESISRITKIECINAFERPESSDQRNLGRASRARNMEGIIHIRAHADTNGCIIVADDICTTGATLYAAADALRENGASKVYGLTFGKVL